MFFFCAIVILIFAINTIKNLICIDSIDSYINSIDSSIASIFTSIDSINSSSNFIGSSFDTRASTIDCRVIKRDFLNKTSYYTSERYPSFLQSIKN